jgi:endonuclease YncB( thermonuclease family)
MHLTAHRGKPILRKPLLPLLATAAIALLSGCTQPMPAEPPAAAPTVQAIPATKAATGSSLPADDNPVLVGSVVQVTDGDTINVRLSSGIINVRLGSIDAPEHDQPGGAEATTALARRLAGRQVELEIESQDQYERLVAIVYLGGENMNSWLVQQGHAWAYRQYMSDPRYCVWEADARLYRRGLWNAPAGSQKAPWEWRRSQDDGRRRFAFTDYQRETVASCVKSMRRADSRDDASVQPVITMAVPVTEPSAGNCLIKGNISESGRIYHVPGSEWYERTQINPAKGERWFCSEAEAKAAGWRAPR